MEQTTTQMQDLLHDPAEATDYLTPEQRIAAIAEILVTGALRVLKERHEQNSQ